jgi:hypothetical protein
LETADSIIADHAVQAMSINHQCAIIGSLRPRGATATVGSSFRASSQSWYTYVDKILEVAKPSELPWEQSTKFEQVIK